MKRNETYDEFGRIDTIDSLAFKYCKWENFPKRWVVARENGLIKYDVGLMPQIKNAAMAWEQGKNIILLGGVGRGKSFLAFELAYQLKRKALYNDKTALNYPIPYWRASMIVGEHKANYSNLPAIIDKVLTHHDYSNSNWRVSVKSLIIDEMDDIAPNDYSLFNEIVFSCYERMIPLIMVSNLSAEIFFGGFSDKAMSRLNESSVIIQADGKDLRQK